jgi:hypothetical protein
MELSPLARERLAKAGELSPEEKEKLKLNEELTSILSDFFTGKLDNDGLWMKMKEYQDRGKESIIKETQLRLIHTLSLGGSDADFKRYSSGALSLETLKSPNRYPEIESLMKNVGKMRQEYEDARAKAFAAMKNGIRDQVRRAAEQIARQNPDKGVVDMESSIEASVRNSPQWRQFIVGHEGEYGQRFGDIVNKLIQLL